MLGNYPHFIGDSENSAHIAQKLWHAKLLEASITIRRMITQEDARRLEETDPRLLTTEQQCAYILKCIEAEMPPNNILEYRFKGDEFTFELAMSFAVSQGWVAKDERSGKWHVNR